MKLKTKFISLLLIIVFFSSGCQPKKKDDTLNNLLLLGILIKLNCSGPNDFWVRDLTTNKSVCVAATLKASGNSVNVFLDNSINPALDFNYIRDQFDGKIKPNSDTAFGPASDINKDGKIDLLITDIKDGATASSGYVAGFFDPIDFYVDDMFYPVRSNEKEILYIDGKELVNSLTKDPTNMVSTIAHETQHLIRFQYILAQNAEDPVWINEGTSEVASEISYGIQSARLSCFNGSTCSGGVNGVPLLQWKNTLQHYAYAYSFMSYLYSVAGTSRAVFLKNSVTGNGGTRASSTENLVNVFKNYSGTTYAAGNFPATDNPTVYKSLLISFLGQAVGYTGSNNIYYGSATPNTTAYATLLANYAMDTTLKTGLTTPSPIGTTTATTVYPGSPFHVTTDTTNGTTNSDIVILKKSISDSMIANGAMTSSGNGTYTPAVSASILEPVSLPVLTLTPHGPECPIGHITDLHRIERQLMKLDERKLDF